MLIMELLVPVVNLLNMLYSESLPKQPDNPLICTCELIWFPNLLQELKNRDDEMTQKKRPMCTMQQEHREYFVQSMPIERMNCNLKMPSANGVVSMSTETANFINLNLLIVALVVAF